VSTLVLLFFCRLRPSWPQHPSSSPRSQCRFIGLSSSKSDSEGSRVEQNLTRPVFSQIQYHIALSYYLPSPSEKTPDELPRSPNVASQLRIIDWLRGSTRIFVMMVAAAIHVHLIKIVDDWPKTMGRTESPDFVMILPIISCSPNCVG
jgi:hypothetical protein